MKSDRLFKNLFDKKEKEPKTSNTASAVISDNEDSIDSIVDDRNSQSSPSEAMEDEESLLVEVIDANDKSSNNEDNTNEHQSFLKQKQDEIINRLYEGLVVQSNPKIFELPSSTEAAVEKTRSKHSGSSFKCTYRNCREKFSTANGFSVHYAYEHSDILQLSTKDNAYYVKTDDTNRRIAFKIFGSLCKRDGTVVDSTNLYCKLCVSNGLRRTFSTHTNYGNLLSHVAMKHNARKYLSKAGELKNITATSVSAESSLSKQKKKNSKKSDDEISIGDDSDVDSKESNHLFDDCESLKFELGKTVKGNPKITINGFVYVRDHQFVGRFSFRCASFVSTKQFALRKINSFQNHVIFRDAKVGDHSIQRIKR